MTDVLEQKLAQALIRGTELMIEHGLGDWTVKLHSKRRALADCNDFYKTIRYSKNFLTVATKEQLEGTTIHEIAHALVGCHHAHDAVFRAKVLELGGGASFAKAKADNIKMPRRYTLTCPSCGGLSSANVRKRYFCISCKEKGSESKFLFSENVLNVVVWPEMASIL